MRKSCTSNIKTFFVIVFVVFTLLSNKSTVRANSNISRYLKETGKEIVITGNVIDEFGYTVVGAKVSIKGSTKNKTITNSEGDYKITAKKESDVLVFSMDGYLKKEIIVKKQREINVELKIDRSKNKK